MPQAEIRMARESSGNTRLTLEVSGRVVLSNVGATPKEAACWLASNLAKLGEQVAGLIVTLGFATHEELDTFVADNTRAEAVATPTGGGR